MATNEHRELDAWIVEHVIPECPHDRLTVDPVAAMEVLKKCGEKTVVSMTLTPPSAASLKKWTVADDEHVECAETLELAICLFAKKLFQKSVT